MPKVTIYTSPACPHCVRAKALLKRRGVTGIDEIDISRDGRFREEMTRRSGGRRTVPQIFIGQVHIGGNDDLQALEKEGRLKALLADH